MYFWCTVSTYYFMFYVMTVSIFLFYLYEKIVQSLEWREFLSNGYIMALIVFLASLAQGTFSQNSTNIINVEGIRLKNALQVILKPSGYLTYILGHIRLRNYYCLFFSGIDLSKVTQNPSTFSDRLP